MSLQAFLGEVRENGCQTRIKKGVRGPLISCLTV